MSLETLQTWNTGRSIAVETYKLCAFLPRSETYSLSDQMRRAAVSVSSNIAEGYGRGSTKEYIKFLYYAKGSVLELKTQIQIALDVNFLKSEQTALLLSLCNKEASLLSSQIASLNKRI